MMNAYASVGSHIITKKLKAPANFDNTTDASVTGAVMRVSIVPERFSSAKSLMVIMGTTTIIAIQKKIDAKNGQEQGIHLGGRTRRGVRGGKNLAQGPKGDVPPGSGVKIVRKTSELVFRRRRFCSI